MKFIQLHLNYQAEISIVEHRSEFANAMKKGKRHKPIGLVCGFALQEVPSLAGLFRA